MNRDIIARKRRYEDLEVDLSWDDRLDLILERRWTWKTWVGVLASCSVGVFFILLVGNAVLGLN